MLTYFKIACCAIIACSSYALRRQRAISHLEHIFTTFRAAYSVRRVASCQVVSIEVLRFRFEHSYVAIASIPPKSRTSISIQSALMMEAAAVVASTESMQPSNSLEDPLAPTSQALQSAFQSAAPTAPIARPPRPIVARTSSAPMALPNTSNSLLTRRDSTTSLETAAALDFAAVRSAPIDDTLQQPSNGSAATTTVANALPAHVLDAVVKVYCTHSPPNFALPWQRKTQHTSGSTGFIISGPNGERWMLTNAHSVSYHSQVKVRKRGGDTRFVARVLSIGRECDIALLTVDEDAFWEGVHPITFGVMPQLQVQSCGV